MDIPMHEDVAMIVQGVLDEAVGGGKVFEEILVVFVVDVNLKMLVRLYELFVNRPAEDGDDVSDGGLCDGLFAPQGEQAGTEVESGDGVGVSRHACNAPANIEVARTGDLVKPTHVLVLVLLVSGRPRQRRVRGRGSKGSRWGLDGMMCIWTWWQGATFPLGATDAKSVGNGARPEQHRQKGHMATLPSVGLALALALGLCDTRARLARGGSAGGREVMRWCGVCAWLLGRGAAYLHIGFGRVGTCTTGEGMAIAILLASTVRW